MKKLIFILCMLPLVATAQVDIDSLTSVYENSQQGQQFEEELISFKDSTIVELFEAAADGEVQLIVGVPQELQEVSYTIWMQMFTPLDVEVMYISEQQKLVLSGWRIETN